VEISQKLYIIFTGIGSLLQKNTGIRKKKFYIPKEPFGVPVGRKKGRFCGLKIGICFTENLRFWIQV
jgi:hypothetical protein